MGRVCASCNRYFDKYSFSNNQWRKPNGISRCHACACANGGGGGGDYVDPTQTARRNNPSEAIFEPGALISPFAEGGFRCVAKGRYVKGPRAGQACVCKWFKSGAAFRSAYEETFSELDLQAMNKALPIIELWNSVGYINKLVHINIPEEETFRNNPYYAGQKALLEPFIQNYQKFNSNTGWADDSTPWARAMQALSHYSYHITFRRVVLCDLQGGVYAKSVVLTDPVILSSTKSFGVTDLGPQGISTFFSNHKCNEFCKSTWLVPRDQRQYFRPQEGTSMMQPQAVSLRLSRPLKIAYAF